jgi:uncharacterized protein (TIGR02145 family)
MKTKKRIWFCPLIVMGFILILANSCKKDPPYMTDQDGNVYTSVTIGTQVWMVENLKTSKYRNGDLIGTTTPATLDITAEATPKYQWAYDDNENNVATYGRLYTWFAVTDSRNVCPAGWHVPTDKEWTTLASFLGGANVAGGKLKETGTIHWLTPNEGATNETGFTALAGGVRVPEGSFFNIDFRGFWWSSTKCSECPISNAWCRWMQHNLSDLVLVYERKELGFSVRCIKDN